MREIEASSLEAIAGGDEITREWGSLAGQFAGELRSHPEAAAMWVISPTAAIAYLLYIH